jgi:hypothetical protein
MKKLISLFGVTLGTGGTAYAAEVVNTSLTYSSSLLVGLFLGFCALIVACQLIPSIMLLIGMLKGVFAPRFQKQLSE